MIPNAQCENPYIEHLIDFTGKQCKLDLPALNDFGRFEVEINARIMESWGSLKINEP